MTAQDCFGIVVRTFGLGILLFGLYYAVNTFFLIFVFHSFGVSVPMLPFFIYSVLAIPLSLYLLRGAPLLMRFCYPPKPSSATNFHPAA